MHAPSLISRILVSSPDVVLDNFKDKIEALQLKINQVVDAKVAKVLPNGKARLTIKGQTVVAKTHVLLTEGEMIKLQAVADGDSKKLKLVSKPTQNFAPEGLKEMRAFGRAGLYSKLTQVLSEYFPAPAKQPSKELSSRNVTGTSKQAPQDLKFQKPVLSNSITDATTFTGKAKPFDIVNLKTMLANKTIPWAQKTASLLVQAEAKTPVAPGKMIEKLAENLVTALGGKIIAGSKKPVIELLKETYQKSQETLSAKDQAIINTAVRDKTVPWEYKLLTLLADTKAESALAGSVENKAQPAELLPLQRVLLQELKQNGILITGESGGGKLAGIHALKDLLELISLKQGVEPDNESLKTIVKNSGLMWESKLSSVVDSLANQAGLKDAEALVNNDIKALAMKLATVLEGEDKTAGKVLRSFVDGLEKMQILNAHSSEESGRYLLPLPFFLNDTLKFGQLLIDLDRGDKSEEKGGDKATRVAFILELSRLGHLKADFSIYKKSISGEFGVENSEIQSLFNQLIPGLIEKFEAKDYTIKRIGCSVISSGELAGTSLTDMVIDNPDGVINIVV